MSLPEGRLSRLFHTAWWAAWCRRHKAKGVKVVRLQSQPTTSFATRDLK